VNKALVTVLAGCSTDSQVYQDQPLVAKVETGMSKATVPQQRRLSRRYPKEKAPVNRGFAPAFMSLADCEACLNGFYNQAAQPQKPALLPDWQTSQAGRLGCRRATGRYSHLVRRNRSCASCSTSERS
jgi:hypothetical protein